MLVDDSCGFSEVVFAACAWVRRTEHQLPTKQRLPAPRVRIVHGSGKAVPPYFKLRTSDVSEKRKAAALGLTRRCQAKEGFGKYLHGGQSDLCEAEIPETLQQLQNGA